MTRRRGVHKVGLVAVAIGLPSLLVMPFAQLRESRIATGDAVGVLESLPLAAVALLAALWLAAAALSARDDRRAPAALARGAAGAAIIVATVWCSELGAVRLLADAARFARVSVGAGAWTSALAAWTLVLAARRELGVSRPLGVAVAASAPLGVAALLATGSLSHLGIMREYGNWSARFWTEAGNHVLLAAVSVGIATVAGVLLGVLAFRVRRAERVVFGVVNVFQTIPGLAMIGLLVAPLAQLSQAFPFLRELGIGGLGWAPVVTALTLYALLAIVRNTYTGLASVSSAVIDAGRGMGMTERQVLGRVRLPLAMPVLFSGIRTSSVQTVGNATLAAFAAAGSLGLFVFQGLAEQSPDLIMLGSIAIVVLALLTDGVMRGVQRLLSRQRTSGGNTR